MEKETTRRVAVGIIGTSWWADAMYLPALTNHPQAEVWAICGRDLERAQQIADRWHIPNVYTSYEEMIGRGELEALIIATPNDTHHPITIRALTAGLHVLCEKPLALTYEQAAEMANMAEAKGVKHMVPFTYRYLPTNRYIKELLDEGYIGRPYHLNLRYYTGYGRTNGYNWRFDLAKAGAGAIADIGSHFLYLAEWFFGEVSALSCLLGQAIERTAVDPDGQPYEIGDDSAVITLRFASGAQGVIHVSTLAYEDTAFGQIHQMEFHGSAGTLHHVIDWDRVQRVSGARQGEGPVRELPVPEHIWRTAPRDSVHNTYKHIFRHQDFMTRQFVSAIVADEPLEPNFRDGARVQRLIEAALQSHRERCWVEVGQNSS